MREKLNNNWTWIREDGSRKTVNLPHDAMLWEKRVPDCVNGINSGYFPGGKYRYEKTVVFTKEDLAKTVLLHFEGVYQNSRVYLNEQLVAAHRYGYTPFDADLSGKIKEGENTIAVDVDNSLEPNCRWYSGSGIYRDVWLETRDPDHIRDLKIETVSDHPAVIRVKASTVLDSKITVEIFEGEKRVVSGEPGELMIPDARLWSAEDPFLYTVRVSSAKDEKKLEYGIRKLRWNAADGLTVNGKRVLLQGGCIHHDHGVLGACEYEDDEYRRIRILKENGFNALRMAHNPASEITLKICDKLGMYVMNEAFDGWYIPKTYHDYARYFEKDWQDDLKKMVESSCNHSCVILYSVGNEVSETAEEKGCRTAKELADYVKSLDPGRPVTAGINVLLNVYAKMGLGVYKEKGEYKAEPLKKGKAYKEKKTGSAFFNMMAQKLGKLMFFMSAGSKGDKACKGAAEALDVLGLNYASSRYDEDVKKYPERFMVGSETMAVDLPYNWERVKKYPQLFGDFVWSAWDYLGEACIGDWSYDSYKGLPLLAGQGMIDITGKPLAAMGFMQVVWGVRKTPYIALRPLNHAEEIPHKGSWQFTNAIDSYSWDGYEGKKAYCEVYAPGDRVTLSLNGKEIGTGKLKEFKAHFRFPYEPGVLKARCYDKNGGFISESELSSGKKETVLTIRTDKEELRAGELCHLEIEFTDEDGKLKPYVEKEIEVLTEGPVRLLGLGSALCKSDEVYTDAVHTTYRGRAFAVVMAEDTDGLAKIIVKSEGYQEVRKELKVKGK